MLYNNNTGKKAYFQTQNTNEIQYVFVWFTQEIIKTTYELNKNNTNIP